MVQEMLAATIVNPPASFLRQDRWKMSSSFFYLSSHSSPMVPPKGLSPECHSSALLGNTPFLDCLYLPVLLTGKLNWCFLESPPK